MEDLYNDKSANSLITMREELVKIKAYKENLQEAYKDGTTNYIQKSSQFQDIINKYRICVEKIKRIVDEELPTMNALQIPAELIEKVEKKETTQSYLKSMKDQLKQAIDLEQEKKENLKMLSIAFQNSLVESQILPKSTD